MGFIIVLGLIRLNATALVYYHPCRLLEDVLEALLSERAALEIAAARLGLYLFACILALNERFALGFPT